MSQLKQDEKRKLRQEILDFLIKQRIITTDYRVISRRVSVLKELDEFTRLLDAFFDTGYPSNQPLSSILHCITHNIHHWPTCHCGKFITKYNSTLKFPSFCSTECANSSEQKKNLIKETNLKRYGGHPRRLEQTKQKYKKTCLTRYGVDHPLKNPSIQQKMFSTNFEKYGAKTFIQSEEGQKRKKQTCNERYNCDYPFQNSTIQTKVSRTVYQKYGVKSTLQLDHVRKKTKQAIRLRYQSEKLQNLLNDDEFIRFLYEDEKLDTKTIANIFNLKDRGSILNRLQRIGVKRRKVHAESTAEKEILEFVRSLGVRVEHGNRAILQGQELDILLPDHNLAIEYNGLYWHSEIYKDSYYHLNKTVMCEQKGIRLIHIFEDEWRDQQQKCKDTLRHLLGKSPAGTFARNAYIKEIPWKQARDFLNKHHLLGAGSSGNYRIGAFDKHTDELIGVMVFGRSTSERSNEIELKRFVTNKRNNPGLGSKMFKYAVKNQGYQEVIAFVDRRWFTGLVKDHIGFQRIYETKPAVWWTDGVNRYHRRFMTKRQLIQELNFDSSKTKREMLKELGLIRIFDCGKMKLHWHIY